MNKRAYHTDAGGLLLLVTLRIEATEPTRVIVILLSAVDVLPLAASDGRK